MRLRLVPCRRRTSGRRDRDPQHEEADRAHHRQEHHPAGCDQARRRRRLGDRRDRELRRRAGVRPDREGEGAAHRMAVDRDRAPVDEVPALGDTVERHDQRVGIGRRAVQRPGGLLVAVGVGDRDDREARLDRLVEGERDVRGRGVHDAARRRHRPDQVRVRRRRDGQQSATVTTTPAPSANGRPPAASRERPLPAAARLRRPARSPRGRPRPRRRRARRSSASSVPPPPSELLASIVGAGRIGDSGPDQLTIDPSE